MSAGAIVAIIVAVALVLVIIGAMITARRRSLRRRFGPEYDRMVAEKGSHRKAEAELAQRERRVKSLDLHPLPEAARATYLAEWTTIQERFVDHPSEAVTQAGLLVVAVMKEQGYPTDDHDQVLADLSVEHGNTLDHYRAARTVSMNAETGSASTEDLRLGMLHYRALFTELLGTPDETPSAGAQPAETRSAEAPSAGTRGAEAPPAETPPAETPPAETPSAKA